MTAETQFQCEICQKSFSQSRYLKSHQLRCQRQQQRSQANLLAKKCGICGKDFSCVSRVQRHQLLVHFNSREHQCPHCSRTFTQAAHLKRHIKALHQTRNEEDRYPCGECNSNATSSETISFPTKWELARHQEKVHSGTYQCETCSEETSQIVVFTSQTSWLAHLDFHNGRKPHLCNQCMLGFKTKSQLANHEKAVHLKQDVFQCSSCEQRFVQRTQVNRHLLKHHPSNILFKCTCTAEFPDRPAFREHLEHKHQMTGKVHLCVHCDKWFSTRESLQHHISKEHFHRISKNDEESFEGPSTSSGIDSASFTLSLLLKFSETYKQENGEALQLEKYLPSSLIENFPSLRKLEIRGQDSFKPGQSVLIKVNTQRSLSPCFQIEQNSIPGSSPVKIFLQ